MTADTHTTVTWTARGTTVVATMAAPAAAGSTATPPTPTPIGTAGAAADPSAVLVGFAIALLLAGVAALL